MHIEGSTSFGKVYIRLNMKKEVTSMYTLFGSTEKYMPEDEAVSSVSDAKYMLEQLLRSKTIGHV